MCQQFALLAEKQSVTFICCLCEKAFSSITYLKNKYRTRLIVENDLRLSLTKIEPNINYLCCDKQLHKFH